MIFIAFVINQSFIQPTTQTTKSAEKLRTKARPVANLTKKKVEERQKAAMLKQQQLEKELQVEETKQSAQARLKQKQELEEHIKDQEMRAFKEQLGQDEEEEEENEEAAAEEEEEEEENDDEDDGDEENKAQQPLAALTSNPLQTQHDFEQFADQIALQLDKSEQVCVPCLYHIVHHPSYIHCPSHLFFLILNHPPSLYTDHDHRLSQTLA